MPSVGRATVRGKQIANVERPSEILVARESKRRASYFRMMHVLIKPFRAFAGVLRILAMSLWKTVRYGASASRTDLRFQSPPVRLATPSGHAANRSGRLARNGRGTSPDRRILRNIPAALAPAPKPSSLRNGPEILLDGETSFDAAADDRSRDARLARRPARCAANRGEGIRPSCFFILG